MADEKRLIDANQAYEEARKYHSDFAKAIADLTSLREVLEDCDTVDAVEVVHGRWVDEYKGQFANKKYICSVCGNRANSDDWKWVLSPYCPNCGAKMEWGR